MRQICLISFSLLLSVISFAQHTHTEFGLKAGVNVANFNDAVNTKGSRTGFHIGGLSHVHFTRTLALQPEIVFSTQGAKYNTGTDKIDYINIPILLQYMFNDGFCFETGPQIGLLTSAKFENNNGTEGSRKNIFKSSDLSWAFGLGYLTHAGLGVDARYNLGVSDIRKLSDFEVKNRVWQFGVFYQFRD